MCTAGDWILVVAIHLSDRGPFSIRKVILQYLEKHIIKPRSEINRRMVKNNLTR